mgnify:FL=1
MKIGKRSEKAARMTNPNKNQSKKSMMLIGVIVVTVLLIMWVYVLGKKAEDTVSVVMWSENIYKNETITENQLIEYKMLKGEFEKYAIENSNNSKTRRIVLWEEREKLYNTFAAYPLQANTVAMITDVVTSRTDNSDTVLYSYPGKNILALKLGDTDLTTFKTFLQPGDRVNITAIYKAEDSLELGDGQRETVESIRQETVFKDIMVADLLNQDGNSVLDLYASYNNMTVYQQAALDVDESWLDSVEPSTLLVALTPEEETLYYEYLSKTDIEFHMSLPQRTE